MHELSIALSLLKLAAAEAESQEGCVTALHVTIGPLSGVVKQALVSAFELARRDTPFAASKLVILDALLMIECPACGGERPACSVQELRCSVCREPAARAVAGWELELTALEMES